MRFKSDNQRKAIFASLRSIPRVNQFDRTLPERRSSPEEGEEIIGSVVDLSMRYPHQIADAPEDKVPSFYDIHRDADFALFDFGGLGNIMGGFTNPLRIGTDLLGDLTWGLPILTNRSPLESFIGDHNRQAPLTFKEMDRLRIL